MCIFGTRENTCRFPLLVECVINCTGDLPLDDNLSQNHYHRIVKFPFHFRKACRNGDLELVTELLKLRDNGKGFFDISCKGKSKSNLGNTSGAVFAATQLIIQTHTNNVTKFCAGWTPLHLATYFGHKDVMEILLSKTVDINAINEVGDTCLHKAAFIGRRVK